MRRLLAALFAGLALIAAPLPVSGETLTPIRFTLDIKYQGIHAWYFIAKEKAKTPGAKTAFVSLLAEGRHYEPEMLAKNIFSGTPPKGDRNWRARA